VVLADGRLPGQAVDGRARAEDEHPDAGVQGRPQQVQGSPEVVLVIFAGIDKGLADLDERGEMENGRETALLEQAPDQVRIAQVALDELGPAGRVAVPA